MTLKSDVIEAFYKEKNSSDMNITEVKAKKNVKFTLGGCIILREKKHIVFEKENKNKRF